MSRFFSPLAHSTERLQVISCSSTHFQCVTQLCLMCLYPAALLSCLWVSPLVTLPHAKPGNSIPSLADESYCS
ncbi:hypothetical protein BCR44DRAFT_1440227 [Catenaria anguillulae PL171]|uniref:Uncharacterized protein n=1 Tax=Catenaria anguillulae PL171 TaxID=765915 RepID=A0A1Y2HEK6_9FUNG|nr:hypothetical protein BCR44DRAFT_1440227 [Catenaria anguillulae PL171]